MPIKSREVKNILVFRNDRFGEFLLNIPAFRALKETFKGSKLTLVVSPYVEELARLIDLADDVLIWENKQHSLASVLKFSQSLRKKDFDLCVILNPSRESNILSFLAAIPVRAGYARKWGFLLTHKIKDNKYLANKHEVEYNLELVGVIGAATENKAISLQLKDNETFNELKGNLIAIHPWTSDSVKLWPIENFLVLMKRMAVDKSLKLVIIGGKAEAEESREYISDIGENILDYTGKTTLIELAQLLKQCKLLITGDSGPMHLASCVGTSVVALFRNDIPGKTAKRWGPWGGLHKVIEKGSLQEITVDEVFNKAMEAMHR